MRSNAITQWKNILPRVAVVLSLLLLAGCFSNDDQWNAKDISSLMPDLQFDLTGSNGNPVKAEDLSGEVRLVFFGFTHCPDVCPTTMVQLKQAIEQMPDELQEDVRIIFVSVDPKRDTPEQLASYESFFGDRVKALTGAEPQLRELAKRYRTTFGYGTPDENGHYDVSHSNAVYVFDQQGKARLLIRDGLPTAKIREDLTSLAAQS
ncbi:MAG: SCO family protein [Marinobacter sp.]|uniref:SCO family protein n=1 Tax=Marinobacter sp. TaxID=50741 RepID=UPI0034A0056F